MCILFSEMENIYIDESSFEELRRLVNVYRSENTGIFEFQTGVWYIRGKLTAFKTSADDITLFIDGYRFHFQTNTETPR